MRIATWNVNSVRARLSHVTRWLAEAKPDVLLLQEIKCENEAFPAMEFTAAGYQVRVLGQKSYNGVAIVSPHAIEDVQEGLPDFPGDGQSRYLEATVGGLRVASIYAPNGNPLGSDKFAYKLGWMKHLRSRMTQLLHDEKPIVLGGDFNVIPTESDVYDAKGWEKDALYYPETRAAWRDMMSLGYTEIFRALHPDEHAYSFWDYMNGAWQQDRGLRIDFFLLSPEAVDRTKSCIIDRAERERDKASDHVPVIVEIEAGA